MLSFTESLPIQVSISFPGNRILIDALGREQRIVPHQSPIREYTIQKNTLTPTESTQIQQMFDATEGGRYYFWYTDKSDYRATKDARVVGFNSNTQGVAVATVDGHFLTKRYVCNNNTHYRLMGQVRNLKLYDPNTGNSEVTGWSYDMETGKVSGLPDPNNWYNAEFEFDVPVRFAESTMDIVTKTKQVNPLFATTIKLVEQRLPWLTAFNDVFNDFISQEFTIDMLYESTTTRRYDNQKYVMPSGFVKVFNYQPTAITEVTLGERYAIKDDDLEWLICFWLNVKGSGAFWGFRDIGAINNPSGQAEWSAFRDNTLRYTLRSPQPKQYGISPLTARVFYEGIHNATFGRGWDGPVLTLCDCVFIQI